MKINKMDCLSCGQCVDACQVNAIRIVPEPNCYGKFEIDTTVCVECRECETICPGECISD